MLETNESDAKSLSRRLENRTFLMDGPSRDARTWPDGWTVWTDERMNGGRGGTVPADGRVDVWVDL